MSYYEPFGCDPPPPSHVYLHKTKNDHWTHPEYGG